MTTSGGPAAIKGFRLQTAYILLRLLRGQPPEHFQPEGQEDLDVLDHDGRPLEHVQVKAYSSALQLSDLASSDSEGERAELPYLKRALLRIRAAGTRETVVSFGSVGPELLGAWRNESRNDERHRRNVEKKLREQGYTDEDLTTLFSRMTFEEVTEEEQRQATLTLLREGLAAGDEGWLLNAVSYWLLTQSEQQAVVSIAAFHAELNGAARHLVEAGAHTRVWGHALRSLLPDDLVVRNPEVLRQELYEGVGARPEHVLANVDVRRPELLGRLDEAFDRSRTVVLRGASGQGKSALAYRYLHEQAIPAFTFEVGRLRDVTHAREVTLAVTGRMRALRVPMWLLIDAVPGDTLWLEVLSDLSRIERLRVLVTVREDDWTRSHDALDLIPHQEVELAFAAEAAQPIFEALTRVRPSEQFLDFGEAWRHYEERGPLLEFVYMVTHEGQRLRARLAGQVRHLEVQWEQTPGKLDFLHAATFAAAAGARVRTLDLAHTCGLSGHAARTTVQALEREHLLRVGEEGVIEGLHAVRSAVLLELLTSAETPGEAAFGHSLKAVVDEDLELFALHALVTLPPQPVLSALHAASPRTWTGHAGLIRALLWWGVREHTELHREVIREAYQEFDSGWWTFLPHDLLGLRALGLIPDVGDWSEHTFLPENTRRVIARLRTQMPSETAEFADARRWLTEHVIVPAPPGTPLDWAGLAELAFYTGLWGAPTEAFVGLDLSAAAALPLEEASEVHYGLSFVQGDALVEPRTALRDALLARFRREAPIAHIEDDGRRINLHFPVPDGEDPLATLNGSEHEDAVLDATLRRLQIALRLFPNHERYAAQGYGHHHSLLPLPDGQDESVRNIAKEYLPPVWGVRWNAVFHRLAGREFLLEDWTAHAQYQLQRRNEAIDTLARMLDGWPGARVASEHDRDRWRLRVFLEALLTAKRKIESHHELPRSAVDPWGLAATTRAVERQAVAAATGRLTRQFDARHHDPYLKALRAYTGSFATFFRQAAEGLFAVSHLAVPRDRNARHLLRRRFKRELHGMFLSLVNLNDVLERLPAMQVEYRARFGDRVDSQELADLEQRERLLLDAAWSAWTDVARVPEDSGGVSHASPEEIELRHEQRLMREVQPLHAQRIHVDLVRSEERWHGHGPTLWLRVDLDDSRLMYSAAEQVLWALHRTLQPTWKHRWMFQVMLRVWHTIVLVPTRAGRPWRNTVWATSPYLLVDEPARERWWNLVPTAIEPAQLDRLGLPLWSLDLPPNFERMQTAISEYVGLTSRMRDLGRLADVPGIADETLDMILSREDDLVTACDGRLRELMSAGAMEGVLESSADLPALLASEDPRWAIALFGEDLFITPPQPEDNATANAIALGVVLDVQRLHLEDRAVEALVRETYTIDAETSPAALTGHKD